MLSKEDFVALTGSEGGPHVSIYMPTAVKGPETRKNPIRLKNALSSASDQLASRGLDDGAVAELLGEARERVEDHEFWQYQSEGLAVFISGEATRWEPLPIRPEEITVVADRFHLRPALPLFLRDGRFRVLAFNQDTVRLFEAGRFSLAERTGASLPDGIAKVKGMTDLEDNVHYHGTGPTPTTGGAPTPKYHAQGDTPKDYREVEIEQYVIELAKAVDDALGGDPVPLVLVAEPKLQARFRDHSRHTGLVGRGVDENPAGLDDERLHREAFEVVRDRLDAPRREALDRLEAGLAREDGATADLGELVPAAVHGRIEAAFVAGDGPVWGPLALEGGPVEIHDERQPDDVDLVDLVAARTAQNGGDVFWVREADWPHEARVAALLRY